MLFPIATATASTVDWSSLITASSFNGIIDGINC